LSPPGRRKENADEVNDLHDGVRGNEGPGPGSEGSLFVSDAISQTYGKVEAMGKPRVRQSKHLWYV
jgi:hypothetical protein